MVKNSKKDLTKIKIYDNKSLSFISILIYIILALIPPILGLLWIVKMQKDNCECSQHWMRDYIKFYFIFIIVYFIISISYITFTSIRLRSVMISILLYMYNFISYAIIIYYIYNLKDAPCECSNSLKRDIIYIWYIIGIIFITIALPGFLYLIYLQFK